MVKGSARLFGFILVVSSLSQPALAQANVNITTPTGAAPPIYAGPMASDMTVTANIADPPPGVTYTGFQTTINLSTMPFTQLYASTSKPDRPFISNFKPPFVANGLTYTCVLTVRVIGTGKIGTVNLVNQPLPGYVGTVTITLVGAPPMPGM